MQTRSSRVPQDTSTPIIEEAKEDDSPMEA